tara:strand:- start:643 stop:876 length:234 start_codon:yes stop_codon:yes gene_type:complete
MEYSEALTSRLNEGNWSMMELMDEWSDRLDPDLIRSQILWHSLGVTDVKDEHAYIQDNINEARRKVVMAKLYKKDTV